MAQSVESLSSANEELLRRRRTFSQKRSLSEYAVTLPNQQNDSVGIHPKDDKFRFFKKGRDFQPRQAKHHYTEEELRILETYESAPILPSQTAVYRKWLIDEPSRGGVESWVIICLVAVITGTLAFILRWICERFQIFSFEFMIDMVKSGKTWDVWMYYTTLSCTFAMLASVIVVYFCPFAAGSGLPEIIGILNGCVVRNVLSFKTLVCKCGSVVFTVLSRLPVGFEGPMIHIGAMVGACMARPARILSFFNITKWNSGSSSSRECECGICPRLCRYRDCQERYSFICVGAASGVASAFSSPITGLIFAMEEISSHWSKAQTWRTFVCCILARSTTEILRSFTVSWLEAKDGESSFNIFRLSESALFDMKKTLELSFFIFIPAVIIGAAGGILGALFIFVNLKGSKLRRKLLSKVESPHTLRVLQVVEVIIIAVICSSIIISCMPLFPCKYITHEQTVFREHGRKSLILQSFNCQHPVISHYEDRKITQKGEYHEGASLLLGSWEQMIRNLFSRKTYGLFNIPSLSLCFLLFWTFSTWISMTSIASGLLIPQLAIGAIYGRMLGEICYSILINHVIDGDDFSNWEWVDPGAFALLGAASFLSGTSRLPITSVVMMVEMTNDVNMALLVMVCVMLSKFIGDRFTHSLYHSVLEYKCIPYLDTNLKVYHEGVQVSMELFTSSHVMKSPVKCVNVKESIKVLANLLLDTNHGGFPVVDSEVETGKPYLGVISRLELIILLTKTERFNSKEIGKDDMDRLRLSYPEYSSGKLKDTTTANAILNKYSTNVIYKNIYVNLLPYTNTSTPTVSQKVSLYRTYIMFTALGLRHLVVTDSMNNVSGIITRKDLLGFAVESNIARVIRTRGLHDNTTDTDQSVGIDIEDDIHVGIQSTVVEEEEHEISDDFTFETDHNISVNQKDNEG